MSGPVTGGRMTWEQAVTGPLVGATCLWQDLDGLHLAPAPGSSPPTSILWGWRADDTLIRMRLDGEAVYVAMYEANPAELTTTVPWRVPEDTDGGPGSRGDLRVAANRGRGPTATQHGAGARYEQIVIEGIDEGTGPLTFLRPIADA